MSAGPCVVPSVAVLLLSAVLSLTACGGGDASDDDSISRLPPPAAPDCQARPEVCE